MIAFSDRVLPIRKDEIGQGHIGLDPAGRHLEGSSRDAKDLLHLRRQRAHGLGLRLNHVAYALVVLLALLAALVELSDALITDSRRWLVGVDFEASRNQRLWIITASAGLERKSSQYSVGLS